MATKERDLIPRDEVHERLMRAVLKGIGDTPLVLKGGTALLLAYGLDRFSEDLDFDAPHKLNLESRIRRSVPHGITLDSIDAVKDTPTVTRYRVRYDSEHGPRALKLEISYRTPALESDTRTIQGFRVAALPRIIDQKLLAAHDGRDTRSKVRDLYDLEYAARRWPAAFNEDLATRLRAYAQDPGWLESRYKADYEQDDLILDFEELDDLALRLHYVSQDLQENHTAVAERISRLPALNNSAGAAFTFSEHAEQALRTAQAWGAAAHEANWYQAEMATIRESILEHGQPPESVAEALAKHSPGAITSVRQAEIMKQIEQLRVIQQTPDEPAPGMG